MDGIGLLEELRERDLRFPVIVITAHGEVPLAVSALKAGAVDFIEKPFAGSILIDAVLAALLSWSDAPAADAETQRARQQLKLLTAREHEVLGALVAGKSNKDIAECLGISPRTVEVHRARVMEKLNVRSLSGLVRVAIVAGCKV